MKEYIERGELKRILKKHYYELAGMRHDFYAGYMTAFHIIGDDIPNAADVAEVVHAKWNDDGRCTNCGGHAPFMAMADEYYESPYCFECGAKMDKEET